MFGGAPPGSGSSPDAEAQAKQMGMNVKEYELAMKMRQRIADNLGSHRSSGERDGVRMVYDGNVKLQSVDITADAIASGGVALGDSIVGAWGDAVESAKKAAQKEFMDMQNDIRKEIT